MSEHLTNHINGSGGKVVLSPLAMFVIMLIAPFVGTFVQDKVSSGHDQGATQTQIQLLAQQQARIQNTYVTRDEIDALKQSDAAKLSRDEFATFRSDLTERLSSIDRDLKSIQDSLRKK